MSDAIDRAVKAATEPPPEQQVKTVRFELQLGPGKTAIVVLPVPVTDIDLFRLNFHLSTWYAQQEAERAKQQGIVLAPANTPLPPPPGRTRN